MIMKTGLMCWTHFKKKKSYENRNKKKSIKYITVCGSNKCLKIFFFYYDFGS